MSYENTGKQETGVLLDFRFLYRRIVKNALLILMCACLTGVGAYIILDYIMKDTYTVSANLYVIPRDNVAGKMNEYNIKAAMQRSVNVLNSDTLLDQIAKTEKIPGQLSAEIVSNSNIITMRASAPTAESACKLLKAGLETYPMLSGYFESGYLLKNLSNISEESIIVPKDQTLLYALVAALLVLAAGFGLIGCMCVFSDRIYSTEQAEALLDMDMMGFLPYIRKKKDQKAILISDERTDGNYNESVDQVVTELYRKMQEKQRKVLMVTGMKENDGKSTIAANIALNLMQRGKKVVLVDCDMRRPAAAKIFDCTGERKKQLSLYLKGKRTIEEIMEKVDGEELSCVFQKKAIANPDRLLAGETFQEMLNYLRDEYDYVILDTPPLGIVRDAEVVAERADAVLMAIRQDEDHAAALNDMIDMLEDMGTEVIGGILNMAKGESLSGNGYYGYKKYYSSSK